MHLCAHEMIEILGPQAIPFFDALVTSVLLNGALASLPLTRKSLEISKKLFLTKFLQVKKQPSYTILETTSLAIEIIAIEEGFVEYMLRV